MNVTPSSSAFTSSTGRDIPVIGISWLSRTNRQSCSIFLISIGLPRHVLCIHLTDNLMPKNDLTHHSPVQIILNAATGQRVPCIYLAIDRLIGARYGEAREEP